MNLFLTMAVIFGLIISPCYATDKGVDNKDEQKRIERVEKGIKALLEKEKCALDTYMVLTTRGNQAQIRIVPVEPEKSKEKTEKK